MELLFHFTQVGISADDMKTLQRFFSLIISTLEKYKLLYFYHGNWIKFNWNVEVILIKNDLKHLLKVSRIIKKWSRKWKLWNKPVVCTCTLNANLKIALHLYHCVIKGRILFIQKLNCQDSALSIIKFWSKERISKLHTSYITLQRFIEYTIMHIGRKQKFYVVIINYTINNLS